MTRRSRVLRATRQARSRAARVRRVALLLLAAGTTLALAACAAPHPRDLVVGEDQCRYCRMEITDPRFGAQVILSTGRIETFDSVECAAGFVRELPAEQRATVWVADFTSGAWVRADSAGFVVGAATRAPMGATVAYATRSAAAAAAGASDRVVDWAGVVAATAAEHGGH